MCCASMFLCIMTMISEFSIIYIFSIFKCNVLLHLDMILILFLLTGTFFSFQNQLYFPHIHLKKYKTFSNNIQSFPRYKVCLFSILSKAQVVDIKYPQGICSPIFVVEECSGLFAHPSIFLIKDLRSA